MRGGRSARPDRKEGATRGRRGGAAREGGTASSFSLDRCLCLRLSRVVCEGYGASTCRLQRMWPRGRWATRAPLRLRRVQGPGEAQRGPAWAGRLRVVLQAQSRRRTEGGRGCSQTLVSAPGLRNWSNNPERSGRGDGRGTREGKARPVARQTCTEQLRDCVARYGMNPQPPSRYYRKD